MAITDRSGVAIRWFNGRKYWLLGSRYSLKSAEEAGERFVQLHPREKFLVRPGRMEARSYLGEGLWSPYRQETVYRVWILQRRS